MKTKTKQKTENNSGITLVALIITIIILVILAAVSIRTLTHDGVVELAIEAGESYKAADIKEREELEKLNNRLKEEREKLGNSGKPGDLGSIEGAIKFGELEWVGEKATVTITKTITDDYEIEYRIEDEEGNVIQDYTKIESGEKTPELNLGDFVIVRLTDGEKHTKDVATLEVKDEQGPIIDATLGAVTASSITIEGVNATDGGIGMAGNVEYSYYIKKSTDGAYPAEPSYKGANTSYTFAISEQGVSYDVKVTAQDKIGNIGTKEFAGVTTNIAPVFAQDSIQVARTTSGMTVSALANDADNEQLTYVLSYGTTNTYGATKEITEEAGKAVTFSLTSEISKTSSYFWKIDVKDKADTVEGKNGKATYCNGYNQQTRTCTTCNGAMESCSACGGKGRYYLHRYNAIL